MRSLAIAILIALVVAATAASVVRQCPADALMERAADRELDDGRLWHAFLEPLLMERRPGTAGHRDARRHILRYARRHLPGWLVEEDRFRAGTPLGTLNFTNIVLTERPAAARKIVLAAHYDSKVLPGGQRFVGATDSAAPCAMIMELAHLATRPRRSSPWSQRYAGPDMGDDDDDVSLQLIFFDGEEAFHEWTADDSLYGSRHLAAEWQRAPSISARAHASGLLRSSRLKNRLDEIQLFVLLDLLGADQPWPQFHQYFAGTAAEYETLADIEQRLLDLGLLSDTRQQRQQSPYFLRAADDRVLQYHGAAGLAIDDDHKPFVDRGVTAVLHLIPAPFPAVWHTSADDRDALRPDIMRDLVLILRAFLLAVLK